MTIFTAIRSTPREMPNSYDVGGAPTTNAESAERHNRERMLVFSLLADPLVAFSSLQSGRFIWAVPN